MITVKLYTKEGCHLCDDVKEDLINLQGAYPHHLIEVDITKDAAIFERYRFTIPVVEINETVLRAPIDKAALVTALQKIPSDPET